MKKLKFSAKKQKLQNNPVKIIDLKIQDREKNNPLDELNSRMEIAEDRINELENVPIRLSQSEHQREKYMEKSE